MRHLKTSVAAAIVMLLVGVPPSGGTQHHRLKAGLQPCGDPSLASVRIQSHGVSGTVIATTEGKSWILGCCHMFMEPWENKVSKELLAVPLVLEGPAQPYAAQKKAAARVLAYDEDFDLSLIEVDNGPFFHVPVAAKGHKPGKNLMSLGFDDMTWPVTRQSVTIVHSADGKTFTRERPWHGRSGGGLIDVDNHCLIGVVWGYETRKDGRGIYVNHDQVLAFVEKHLPRHAAAANPSPVPIQAYAETKP